jgi:hypothetical protein
VVGATPAAQPGVTEADEGPGWRKGRWSSLEKASGGRVVGNVAMVVLVGNVTVFVFILRKGERMKVKGNRSIGLVVHKPRKHGVRTSDSCTIAFPNWLEHLRCASGLFGSSFINSDIGIIFIQSNSSRLENINNIANRMAKHARQANNFKLMYVLLRSYLALHSVYYAKSTTKL